jgi:hypothetical protein
MNRTSAGARIPVKLHRRVCLIVTEDAVLAEELLARKKVTQDLVGRLTDRALLVRLGRAEAVVQELQKMGHTPSVISEQAAGYRRQATGLGPESPDGGRFAGV